MNKNEWRWYPLHVNPEPWAIGDLAVGRRSGKLYPYVGRNQQLFNYKEAIAEELRHLDPIFLHGPIELRLFFWRRRDDYRTPQSRIHRKHEADGTNLAKATEDALQGILFKNDKDVNYCEWVIVEQGPDVSGKVIVGVRKGDESGCHLVPRMVLQMADELDNAPQRIDTSNEWTGT